ncbi:MAG: serine/threonine-protein kinase, partial [Victivallales bacterium]
DPASRQEPSMGKIGPYKIIEFLGRGGAGIVYRAVDSDKAEVAIKVITATPFVPQSEIRRFIREAETSKLLRRHPNIITVYDTGQDGHDYYISMELVPGGKTLHDIVGMKLSVKEVLAYAVPVAQALAFAHKEGILHRDLKPANILINEFNQPLLADFGLAKTESSQQLTLTGNIVGTPKYMSPEQCGMGDGEVTNQSDIYSFGFVIYELLTGGPPYPITPEMQLAEVFRLIRDHEAVPPRKLRKDISRNLEAVVLRMLEKEKKLRYKDMAQVCADLEACQAGMPVSVRRLSWAERWEKWLRKHSSQAITAAVAISIAACLYYFLVIPWMKGSGFAKQKVDLIAVTAKHRSERLEEELEALKHPGTPAGDEAAAGTALLLKGRESLSGGRLDKAEAQYVSAAEWAEKNGHNGILLESRNSLARIELARGSNDKAAKMFQDVASLYGRNTLNGQLALFEAGAALWLHKNDADSFRLWQEIAAANRRDSRGAVDNKEPVNYINLLSRAMLGRGKNASVGEIATSCPTVFKGLGYWVLAQNTAAGKLKNEYLAEAMKNKGIFVWIKQEEENDGKK